MRVKITEQQTLNILKEVKVKLKIGDYVYDKKFDEVFILTPLNLIAIKLDMIGRFRPATEQEIRMYNKS